ncbi:MAG: DUF948 domain-containing protein [Thermoleophilia bacterium]|jgi:exonuclease VII small subunit
MNEENATDDSESISGEVHETQDAGAEAGNTGEDQNLTRALESTLESLSQSIERMEDLVRRLGSGDSDWEESVRLLAEANELAMSSSQQLDRAVQDVMYGAGDETAVDDGAQQKLPINQEE